MMNAIALPVRSALAGQRMMRLRLNVTTTSISAQVRSDAGDLGEREREVELGLPST